jgi:hypothetical protein
VSRFRARQNEHLRPNILFGRSVARKSLSNLSVKCHIYMKTIFNISILAVLLVVAPHPCFAMRSIGFISRKEAKELGMDLRFKGNGTNEVWVELEFKAEGKFKNFSHVELEIREGKKFLLGWAPLQSKRTSSGSVLVYFLANRAYLHNVTLTVVLGSLGEEGYQLRVKDFVELEKAH